MTETLIRTFGGNIGIGTTNPGSYKLYVHGGIKADSMRVGGADNTQVPIGLIWMWYGTVASIPSGWALCNGQTVVRTDNGQDIPTPDLVDHFIRGADGDAPSPAVPGQTGGANTLTINSPQLPIHAHDVTLDDANAPHDTHPVTNAQSPHGHGNSNNGNNHAHNVSNYSNPAHRHSYNYKKTQPGVGDDFVWAGDCKASQSDENRWSSYNNLSHNHNSSNDGQHSHSLQTNNVPHAHTVEDATVTHGHTVTLGDIGSGQSIDIKNRYYVLAYIMKH